MKSYAAFYSIALVQVALLLRGALSTETSLPAMYLREQCRVETGRFLKIAENMLPEWFSPRCRTAQKLRENLQK